LREQRDGAIVVDEDRDNESDLAVAPERVTPEAVNFMVREGAAWSAWR